jgi:tRNA pseudouridine38-40 synthase
MRIAVRLAYIGTDFHGSQYQPDLRTVEGELFKALEKMEIDPKGSRFRMAGRTDAGVHAIAQTFAVDVESTHPHFLRILNSHLPRDMAVWAVAEVSEDFDPRYNALSRTYVYAMVYGKGEHGEYDFDTMVKCVKKLKGTHDFSNFTKGFDGGKREVYRAELRQKGEFIYLEIEANAFTWNMVRCIASALRAVGRGDKSVQWFEEMLKPEVRKERIEPASPHGLILKDVKYNVDFEVDLYSFSLVKKMFNRAIDYHGSIFGALSVL